MGIGSQGFQDYNRVLATALGQDVRKRALMETEREKLRRALAALPWRLPAPSQKREASESL